MAVALVAGSSITAAVGTQRPSWGRFLQDLWPWGPKEKPNDPPLQMLHEDQPEFDLTTEKGFNAYTQFTPRGDFVNTNSVYAVNPGDTIKIPAGYSSKNPISYMDPTHDTGIIVDHQKTPDGTFIPVLVFKTPDGKVFKRAFPKNGSKKGDPSIVIEQDYASGRFREEYVSVSISPEENQSRFRVTVLAPKQALDYRLTNPPKP